MDERSISLRTKLNNDFETHIPEIYIEQIKRTHNTTKKHFTQLKDIHYFCSIFIRNHPHSYLSKSGIRIGAWPEASMFCKNPIDEGTVENMLIFLEKQFFDCVSLLFSGAYRPIMTILRYMLELTTWVTVSILNKKKLTKKLEDVEKAMSYIQFESFLIDNFENIQKIKSPKTKKKDKQSIQTIQGIQFCPEQYLKHLTYKYVKGNNAIRLLYSELSGFAHANIFQQLRWDGGDEQTHIEHIGLFVGKFNLDAYHFCLDYIIKTHEIIFHLLLVSSYANIGYYNKELADRLFLTMQNELTNVKQSLRFESIESLLIEKIPINQYIGTQDKEFVHTDEQEEIEDEDDEDIICQKCNYPTHDPDEECITCHYLEFSRPSSNHPII
ncbi:hypothetical protein C6988_02500 [Nitrosopumilus sp. b1]|uniref:hypothetical protein n=1 Tax=Nitrosopumilus sp. b1 TaxID=2109907 RepID=UPI0015F7538E|nr:hypothetical protein [Nitrosopumilus sp. b1]KAF6243632.1 hypothetical protein C6988_02500 [Nitrosopumilus sp. b1]